MHPDSLQILQKDIQILFSHLQTKKNDLELERVHRDTVLESINDGIVVLDENDYIKYLNNKLRVLFGVDSENWHGAHVSELYKHILDNNKDSDLTKLQTVYYSVVGKQNLVADMCEISWQSHSPRYIRVYTGPISHPKQIYMGRVWKFEDITDEKELEQMRVEFVSLASHQLRTPLTAIWGYLKMIEKGDFGALPVPLQKPLSVVLSSTSHMKELVNDLLDVSHLDAGKVSTQFSNVEIVKLINEEITGQLPLAQKQKLEIKLTTVLPELVLETDPKLLREIFKNFLSNAIKYSKPGTEVEVIISFASSKSLRILVKDHGIGIPASQQASLFQKFFRADNARTGDYEGTGLGLYFVKKCVQLISSTIGFKSIQDHGSEFWVDLPIKHQQTTF